MDIFMIPTDLLVKVLSHLGSPQDVGNAAQVCRYFCRAAKDDTLWQEMAHDRYGSMITEVSLPMYNHSYRQMVLNDNRLGGLPTLYGQWKCPWKYNSPKAFFCCLITCIKWHRFTHEVWVYIDARGEFTLREPESSGLWRDGNKIISTHQSRNHHSFESELPQHVRGHYKGKIRFSDSLFRSPGEYIFCYGNSYKRPENDYVEVPLFTIKPEQTLRDALCSFSQLDESPFSDDTPDKEHQRWKPHIPPELFNRPNHSWWV